MNKLTILLGEDTSFLLEELNSSKFDDSWRFPFPEVKSGLPLDQQEQWLIANKLVETLAVCSKLVLCTHSQIIFDAIRLNVVNKKLQPFEIDIRWFERNRERKQINMHPSGNLSFYPSGMFDTLEIILGNIVTARINRI